MTQSPAPLKNPQGQFSGNKGVHEVDSTRTPHDYHIALGLPFYDYSFYSSVRLIVKYMYEKKNNN